MSQTPFSSAAMCELETMVETFLNSTKDLSPAADALSTLQRAFISWKCLHRGFPAPTTAPSSDSSTFSALGGASLDTGAFISEAVAKKIQSALVSVFNFIARDASLMLPTSLSGSSLGTDASDSLTSPETETVSSTSFEWDFMFQTVKQGKSSFLFTTPSIVRQVVSFQKTHSSSHTTPAAAEVKTGDELPVPSKNSKRDKKDKKKNTNSTPLASVWAQVFLERATRLVVSTVNDIEDDSLILALTTLRENRITFSLSDSRESSNAVVSGFIDVSIPSLATSTTASSFTSLSSSTSNKRSTMSCELIEASSKYPRSQRDAFVPSSSSCFASTPTSTSASATLVSSSSIVDEVTTALDPDYSRHCMNPFEFSRLNDFKFGSLGYIDSCFKFKYGTPRQGSVVPSSRARLVLHSGISADSIIGISEYSHVWLLFVFHSNTHKKYHPKIAPPRLKGQRVGCLATRTPHRWNDIGLSLVRLERVEVPFGFSGIDIKKNNAISGRVPIVQLSTDAFMVNNPSMTKANAPALPGCAALVFSGVDLVDGTPIIDVKPYHPSDCVLPDDLTIPSWQRELPLAALKVRWSLRAKTDLHDIFTSYEKKILSQNIKLSKMGKNVSNSPLQFYDTEDQVSQAITETLSMDPRPICTKTRHEEGIYGFVFDNLNIVYRMVDNTLAEVCFVEYRDSSKIDTETGRDTHGEIIIAGAEVTEVDCTSNTLNERGVVNRKREIMNQKNWLEQVKAKLNQEVDVLPQ